MLQFLVPASIFFTSSLAQPLESRRCRATAVLTLPAPAPAPLPFLSPIFVRCYARLPAKATNCRKKKCGHTSELR
jgi:hypothetical protein